MELPKEDYQTFINESIQQRFNNIDGEEFEEVVAKLYRDNGHWAKKPIEDYGCDVILKKDDTLIAIQCKNYKTDNSTGNKAIQEANSGKDYHHCDQAMVITTSYYTHNAKRQAQASNVELWDWEQLKPYIINTYNNDQEVTEENQFDINFEGINKTNGYTEIKLKVTNTTNKNLNFEPIDIEYFRGKYDHQLSMQACDDNFETGTGGIIEDGESKIVKVKTRSLNLPVISKKDKLTIQYFAGPTREKQKVSMSSSFGIFLEPLKYIALWLLIFSSIIFSSLFLLP